MGLGKVQQKGVTSYTVFRSADYLKFLMGLGKIFTRKCAQSHVSSLWRLTWVFDGTWKNFHKMCAQSHVSSLWRLTWVFDATWKVSTKKCDQLHGFSQCRLSQVFDGFWKNFHEKVCPVTRLFAVETNLSFWCDLESFDKKSVTSYTFFRCGD